MEYNTCGKCGHQYEDELVGHDDLCNACAEDVIIEQRARIAELESIVEKQSTVIDLMQPFAGHGCLDGDCQHDNPGDCLMAIRAWMIEVEEAAIEAARKDGE